MATRTITIPFANEINASLTAKAYSVSDSRAHDLVYKKTGAAGTIILLGECVGINRVAKTVDVEILASMEKDPVVSTNDFIFFGKNQTIGTSGMTGYYAEVEMKNSSTSYAELFAVSSEVFESSK
tara:strand:+ start:35 stop:409 length:375 start_codon:yes stop_codon:yes gene_type:complete